MRLSNSFLLTLSLLVLSAACRPVATTTASRPDPFHQHVDDLYTAAKEFEAVTSITKTDGDRLRQMVEKYSLHYVSARDWVSDDQERKLVESYGEALSPMRRSVFETQNFKTMWDAGQNTRREEASTKLAGEAMRHSQNATAAMDRAVDQLTTADKLYVEYRRGRPQS